MRITQLTDESALDADLSQPLDYFLNIHGSPLASIKHYKESIYHLTVALVTCQDGFEKDHVLDLKEMYNLLESFERTLKRKESTHE